MRRASLGGVLFVLFVLLLVLGFVGCRSTSSPTAPPATAESPSARGAVWQAGVSFVDIAASDDHTCAARSDGAVYCWGEGDQGQLGVVAKGPQLPVRVPGVDEAVQVSASSSSICARTKAGQVFCWGHEGSPKAVSGLKSAAVQIETCRGSCARHADGTVSCWGDISAYVDDKTTLYGHEKPFVVPGLSDAVGLACLPTVFCAKRKTGVAFCWGAVEEEMTAASAPNPDPEPTKKSFESPITQSASASSVTSCFGGQCWSTDVEVFEKEFPDEDKVRSISVAGARSYARGASHACSVASSGEVFCRGDELGELVDNRGRFGDHDSKGMIRGLLARTIAAGERHTCAITLARSIVCWGDNMSGQLGDGYSGTFAAPTRVAGLGRIRGLAASTRYSSASPQIAAIEESSGRLGWWWKYGTPEPIDVSFSPLSVAYNGALMCAIGSGGEAMCALISGVAKPPTWIKTSGKQFFVSIDVGGEHICAIDADANVWCWGSNRKGALGNGTSADSATPVRVKGLADVVELEAGDAHSCARTSRGKVYCWGKNNQGRLGDGTTVMRRIPVAVTGLEDATDIAVGKDTTCAARRNGSVVCWGRALDTPSRLPSAGLREVEGISPSVGLTVGCSHACSRTEGGKVQCWGSTRHGQASVYLMKNANRQISGLPSVRGLAASCENTCAVTKDGEAYCWGARSGVGDGIKPYRAEASAISPPADGW